MARLRGSRPTLTAALNLNEVAIAKLEEGQEDGPLDDPAMVSAWSDVESASELLERAAAA
jgi:hypothetical protein